MKKRKKEIAKILGLMLLPFINLIAVGVVSIAFAKPFSEENDVKNIKIEKDENEKMLSVYFHNSGETKLVDMENYLVGVVPAEMPPAFEDEALKAQAVAARTFIINKEGKENKEHPNAVVCTDFNHCKAYISESDCREKWGEEWDTQYKEKIKNAVYSTKGEVVTYEGEAITAVFHSTSSGKTENSEDVWQTSVPYLKSVESEGENMSPRYTSTKSFTFDEFKNTIVKSVPDIKLSSNPQNWFGEKTYNESGSVKTMNIGGVKLKGTEIRSIFGLRSANFNISVGDEIVFNVTGNGHGVGMSQYGANYAAQNGYTYDKILKKYYQGTSVEKIY